MRYRSILAKFTRFAPQVPAGIRIGLIAIGLWLVMACGDAIAQQNLPSREYPSDIYYRCFELIDDGDYVSALNAFRSASRSGLRTPQGSFIDAVCYSTMMGECYYQMGDLSRALEQFVNACELLVVHNNWLLRIEFPLTLSGGAQPLKTPISWGTSRRRTTIARMPPRYMIRQGGPAAAPVLAPAEFLMVNAHEITRCAVLAMRRRAQIMGAACRHDQLTDQLVATFTERPAQPNHWSQAWVDAMLGMAYLSAGRNTEAVTELTKSLQLSGQYDHPLTALALLQLGDLAFQQQQYESAATAYLEATFTAAWFEQHDVMAEAFDAGALTHLVTGPRGLYLPLDPAIAWARRERSALLESSLLIDQARNAAELNETASAAGLIDRARRAMLRKEMQKGAVGARFNYVAALVAYQAGNLNAGEAAWNDVVAFQTNPQRVASRRLFEIGLVDGLAVSGKVTPRVALGLYSDVLREPQVGDWTINPVETMTTVLAPNYAAFEHWFQVALERNEKDRAAEIADRIRRLRFYSTLPMGGRLLALTWVLETPKETLSERTALQRQDLMTRFPKYGDASRQAAALREQLQKARNAGADNEANKPLQKMWVDLATLSQSQEIMLREIALRREPSDFLFPPPLDMASLQAALPKGKGVLAFFVTSQAHLHAFLVGQSSCEHWRIEGANKLSKELSDLLRQFGQFDRNTPVDLELLQNSAWKANSARLWSALTNGAKPDKWRQFEELVIVPDRTLWYFPFETAILDAEKLEWEMFSATRLRYVPTVSLAYADRRPSNNSKDLAIVMGKLLSKSDGENGTETAATLRKVMDNVTEYNQSLPAPSSLWGSLGTPTMVLQDITEFGRGPYDWAPLQLEQDKPGNLLAHWLGVPWGAPDHLVLPGFHTGAETAMRNSANGDEVFLSACGLMGSGSRTVLLSRWRTGGQSSLDLMKEFVQELPYSSATNAWQRSVQLARDKELRLEHEPRVKAANLEAHVKADHPFFWAGYLLLDTGTSPKAEEPKKKP